MANRSFFAYQSFGGKAAVNLNARRSCDATRIEAWALEAGCTHSRYSYAEGWHLVRCIAPDAVLPKLEAWANGANIDILNEL